MSMSSGKAGTPAVQTGVEYYPTLNARQTAVDKVLGPFLESVVGQWGKAYPGTLPGSAGPNAMQTQAYDMTQGFLGAPNPQANLIAAVLRQGLSMQPGTLVDPQFTQDYFNKGVKAPVMEALREEVLPAIRNRFQGEGGMGGYASSDALEAEWGAGRDVLRDLAGILGGLTREDALTNVALKEAAIQRGLGTLPLAEQERTRGVRDAAIAGEVGTWWQQLNERPEVAAYNEWLRRNPSPVASDMTKAAIDYLNTTTQAVMPTYSEPTPPENPSPWPRILASLVGSAIMALVAPAALGSGGFAQTPAAGTGLPTYSG